MLNGTETRVGGGDLVISEGKSESSQGDLCGSVIPQQCNAEILGFLYRGVHEQRQRSCRGLYMAVEEGEQQATWYFKKGASQDAQYILRECSS